MGPKTPKPHDILFPKLLIYFNLKLSLVNSKKETQKEKMELNMISSRKSGQMSPGNKNNVINMQ